MSITIEAARILSENALLLSARKPFLSVTFSHTARFCKMSKTKGFNSLESHTESLTLPP